MINKMRDRKRTQGMVVEVKNDDFGKALRTFSKKVQDSGVLKEYKDRMSYEPPSVKRQRMNKQARKRWERKVEEYILAGIWHKDRAY